jgi:hypothetical protein
MTSGTFIGYDAGQDSSARSVWTGWPVMSAWTGQSGQDREDGMPGHDSKDSKLRQGNGDGTTVAGQSGYDIWDRTTKTGQPGQVSLDR